MRLGRMRLTLMAITGARENPSRPAPFWIVWKQRPLVLSIGENIVGRDASCDVWVDASGVSRRHACIRVAADATGLAATIEDLEEHEWHVRAESSRQRDLDLSHGDRIRVGEATLVFRRAAADEPTKRVKAPRRAR